MKFSQKIFDKMVKKDLHAIASKLVKESAMKKDSRSKGITETDKINAKKTYERMVKGKLANNPHMTMREAYDKVMRSRMFTSRNEIAIENMRKTAKDFGYNIKSKKYLKFNPSTNGYDIIGGKYAGRSLIPMPDPMKPDSVRWILV